MAGSFAVEDIGCLAGLEITTGTSATTYSPDELVTREEMAAFLGRTWRALGNVCPSDPVPFVDVAGSFALADIACIAGLEITTGTSATTYSPDGLVTREEMAAFLGRTWRALGNACPSVAVPFGDVAGSFAVEDIGCLAGLEITTGTSATTYSPDRGVTREETAAFLARLIRANTTS